MIAEDMRLSRAMADAVRRCDELELITQELSITTFRCVPGDLRPKLGEPAIERYLDVLNRHVLDRLQHGGEAFVSNAVVANRYVLRACIVNFHTTHADVEATVDIAARLGREVNAELSAAITGAARSPQG
jgi:glutamate/tyrosine decarboxylase-like PLP-dependent enzyme